MGEQRKPQPRYRGPTLPLGPLLDCLPACPWWPHHGQLDVEGEPVLVPSKHWLADTVELRAADGGTFKYGERTWRRFATEGIDPLTADRIATALGKHPAEVWGVAWCDALDNMTTTATGAS